MRLRSIRLAAVIGTLIGCTPAVDPQLPPGAVKLTDPTEIVVAEQYSGIVDRRRLVIRDAQSWSTLWNEAFSRRHPRPPVPSIDFAEHVVIAASTGTRSNGGYGLTFDAIHEADGVLYAVVREISPGRNCITTQALTNPVIAVRVPRRGAQVTFIERAEITDC